tara:strand:+ start:6881 stop:7312 length:432 start_codon:yes stop_codon:yes gene_type:complete
VASNFKAARDQVETDWEGLTPPSETGRPYRKADYRAAGHRVFWFEPSSIEAESLMRLGADQSVNRYTLDAMVRLLITGRGADQLIDAIVDEAGLLINTINKRSAWTTGVRGFKATGYRTEQDEEESLLLVIGLDAVIEETDGF